MKHSKTLGLVGGLGVEAGIYYYERLVEAHAQAGATPRLLMVHADVRRAMGHVINGELEQLARYLGGLIRQLAAGGAEVAAIPAVTPHICIDALVEASPIPLVSILEATSDALRRRGLRRIALFGTRFVIESDLYGALPGSIAAVRPLPAEIERIDHLYRTYAVTGQGGEPERDEFTRIANELCTREHLDAVVLAGTDLSALFESHEPAFPYADTSQIHINAIMQTLLS